MPLLELTRGVKDNALSLALKALLNEHFSDYGEALECEIDTRKARVRLLLRMKGERENITVTIEHYSLEKRNGKYGFVPHRFSSSRTWITRLLTRLFAGQHYILPYALSKLLGRSVIRDS